ncbi:hypothetical protein FPHYL_6092 [Fusarium phyllophilum]|uniref:Uncharacterized protein n=1 Tax=Fusarium phyllophilum TaxID=47803 RepID=A0A8H5JTP5_9HYPO|nr:hypothetical protein FPHYL_6092 [Fusarium phyllophilum]
MFTIRTTLLSLAALTSSVVDEHLRIVWSKGDFSTISGPNGGNQNGQAWTGPFRIVDSLASSGHVAPHIDFSRISSEPNPHNLAIELLLSG